jgi:hypothetical protein
MNSFKNIFIIENLLIIIVDLGHDTWSFFFQQLKKKDNKEP